VADAYQNQGRAAVHLVKKGLYQLGTLAELPAVNKNDSVFTAMVCFDFHSSVERKNPLAAVQGFLSAFPRIHFPDCRMVVKTTPTSPSHWGDPNDQMGKIRRLAAEDDRIVINDTLMPVADFWRYLKTADCLVSTHRAEGFGYLPAYAMSLGIPVIATDYGGSTDFCTASTASPIAYSLKEVPKGHSIFETPGARWADARRDDVATALRAIYTSSDEANARARFGRSFIRREYSIEAYAARCQARLKYLGVL
jgi:glycosyltransferase involved in cell wall biosynthesis